MKAFKKWLEKYSHGELVSQRYELEDAWKAALKWLINNGNAYCSGEIDSYGEWEECPTLTVIKEELNNDIN